MYSTLLSKSQIAELKKHQSAIAEKFLKDAPEFHGLIVGTYFSKDGAIRMSRHLEERWAELSEILSLDIPNDPFAAGASDYVGKATSQSAMYLFFDMMRPPIAPVKRFFMSRRQKADLERALEELDKRAWAALTLHKAVTGMIYAVSGATASAPKSSLQV